MEWTKPSELPQLLKEKYHDKLIQVVFTQWEDDELDADETITSFEGFLVECAVAENKFSGLDGAFHFQAVDEEEICEILMDFPADGEDTVAVIEGSTMTLYGNESTLVINTKGL